MIIAATGHRLDKLGYQLPNPIYNRVCQRTQQLFLELKPEKVISGMAIGYDQWFANIARKLNIPFIAAIPFIGQEKMWPENSQKAYRSLLNKASEKVIVSDGGYAAWKMQTRNEYLVDNCDLLMACYNETDLSGGTYNCLQYARKVGKQIIIINPNK